MSYECYDFMSNRLNYHITLTISVNKDENGKTMNMYSITVWVNKSYQGVKII